MFYSENMGAGGAVTIFKSISSLKAVLTSTINELTLRGISESPHLTGEIIVITISQLHQAALWSPGNRPEGLCLGD